MEIITYSERGMIDSLIYSLNEDNAKDLIVLAFKELKKEKISNIKFYLEQSLSQFGEPDIIISFNYDKKQTIVFVEGKVSNGNKNWKIKDEYDKYKNNICSNFFWQIGLKKLLIIKGRDKSESEIKKQGISSPNSHIMRKRTEIKLGSSNPVVQKLYSKVIKNAQVVKYLGIVPEQASKNEIQFNKDDKELFNDVQFITWRDIENFAKIKQITELLNNFKWNEGLIYND